MSPSWLCFYTWSSYFVIDRFDPEKDKYMLLVRGIFVNVVNGYRRCCCMRTFVSLHACKHVEVVLRKHATLCSFLIGWLVWRSFGYEGALALNRPKAKLPATSPLGLASKTLTLEH